jgi:outer membrane protein OmpA-like peptidoglycan-associated protein
MEKKQQRFLTIVFAIGASLLFLVACSSTTPPPKSAEKAPVQAQNRTVASQQVRTVAGNPGSSLEAHREGKTPAAGPLKDIYFDFDKYNLSADAGSTQIPCAMAEKQPIQSRADRRPLR